MSEVRRFMRYVLPGMVFVVELALFLLISHGESIKYWLKDYADQSLIGATALLLISSGALGYIFAIIYHAAYWCCTWVQIDHRCLFEGERACYRLVDMEGRPIPVTKRMAWMAVTQYWYSILDTKEGESLRGSHRIMNRLVDITHSLGGTSIATLVSLAGWWAVDAYVLTGNPQLNRVECAVVVIVWILLMAALCVAYYFARQAAQVIANSTLAQRLHDKPGKIVIATGRARWPKRRASAASVHGGGCNADGQ